MKSRKYPPAKNDEWIHPLRTRFKMACCDCGLVHTMKFKIVNDAKGRPRRIVFSARRAQRETTAMRRGKRYAKVRAALKDD